MGMLATYIAVDGERLDKIWNLPDDDFRNAFLDIENDKTLPRLELDKIWDALHCTLTGKSASDPIEGDRLSESIVGTYPRLFDDQDYSLFVSVIDNAEILEISNALEPYDRNKIASIFDAKSLKRNKIYPPGIWDDPPDQLIDEMVDAINSIKQFFLSIADSELHILATFI